MQCDLRHREDSREIVKGRAALADAMVDTQTKSASRGAS
jgi:hypothetical protein